MALLANINRSQSSEPYKIETFIPDYWDERTAKGPNLLAKFRAIMAAQGK